MLQRTGALVMSFLMASSSLAAGNSSDREFTNSIGMKFLRIEPGSFLMGSASGGDFDERPVHRVHISRPYHLSVTEVTNAQYEQFDSSHAGLRGRRGISKDDDEAVVFVSWHEAVKFCEWLSAREGKTYRLPTEAEWEYACRAGTTTRYHTGDELPESHHRNQKEGWEPVPVPLHVGRAPANSWGLHDLHGNVEEWCHDWYGPYPAAAETDPVGATAGDFRVTRGGSHGTPVEFLRSANRLGTLPEDRHWLIGFRVVLGELPKTSPHPPEETRLWAQDVQQEEHTWSNGPPETEPYFRGPRTYVKIAAGADGPMFSRHNHQPALTACPNGDLLAIWYTTGSERGRELAVVASRLRRGGEEWDPASPFWDAPDRNDHGSGLLWDGKKTIYHFNGLGTDGTWGKLALVLRTSVDSGRTWSRARLIAPEHELRHQVIAGAFLTREGFLVCPCDAVPGGSGGTAIHISRDGGQTWTDPGAGRDPPGFAAGERGAWIAGIHAALEQLGDGRLLAFGRGNNIDGQMPRSVSDDLGQNWTYSASGFPPIGGGQRPVLIRLREGPLFFASFTPEMTLTDAAGNPRRVKGLFGALSLDEGETWPVRRLITDDGPPREVDGGGNTGRFTLGPTTAEPRGYLASIQAPDGVIHLISSKQHYQLNLAWLREPMPAAPAGE